MIRPLNPASGLWSAVSSQVGPSPSRNRILCLLALKYDIWSGGSRFNDFPEINLPKVHPALRQIV